jgi:hypothetical protein
LHLGIAFREDEFSGHNFPYGRCDGKPAKNPLWKKGHGGGSFRRNALPFRCIQSLTLPRRLVFSERCGIRHDPDVAFGINQNRHNPVSLDCGLARIVLIQDVTIAFETPETLDGEWANKSVINMVESEWGRTTTVDDLQTAFGI